MKSSKKTVDASMLSRVPRAAKPKTASHPSPSAKTLFKTRWPSNCTVVARVSLPICAAHAREDE